MSFWQSFQGILGPHGFKGFKAEDMFDDERWKFKATPEWENPNVMGAALGRPAGTYNYQPRGGIPSKPGASIASTRPRTIRRPQSPQQTSRQRTTPLSNTPQLYGVPIPTKEIRRVAEETGQYWRPKLDDLARTTGDYWGPKADRVMDETAQFWNPMIKRDLGKLEETWNRADLVGDTKRYWAPKAEQVWSDTMRAYQPKWEDLLKYLRRGD